MTAKGTVPKPLDQLPLSKLSNRELIGLLSQPNDWYARTARRILAERRDKSIRPRLYQMLLSETDERLSLQLLWAVYVSGGFNDALAKRMLAHQSESVRAWTCRLLCDERQVSLSIAARLAELARVEESPSVRSQLASSAKRLPGRTALPIIEELLGHDEDVNDPHIPLLLWWAIEDKAISHRKQVLQLVASVDAWNLPLVRTTVIERLTRRYLAEERLLGFASCAKLLSLAEMFDDVERVIAAMDTQLSGRHLERVSPVLTQPLAALLGKDDPSPELIRIAVRMDIPKGLERALQRIADRKTPQADRVAYLQAVGEANQPQSVPVLLELLGHSEPQSVHLAVLSALERSADDQIPTAVLSRYPKMNLNLQSRTRDLLCARQSWSRILLDAVTAQTVDAKELSLEQLRRILLHDDPELQAIVEKRWGRIRPSTPREKQDRISAVYQILRRGRGDLAASKLLYIKHCGTCHQLHGEGRTLGPDLTAANRKNLGLLLLNTINPSAIVHPQYRSYVVATKDRQALTGLMADSAEKTITILDAKNKRTVLARDDVETLQPSDVSLMPEKILSQLKDR